MKLEAKVREMSQSFIEKRNLMGFTVNYVIFHLAYSKRVSVQNVSTFMVAGTLRLIRPSSKW